MVKGYGVWGWVGSMGINPIRAMSTQAPRVKMSVNGQPIEVPSGVTVLQACESAGVSVPRFCYHERLSIAGNCRMCLVEIENAPKLAASCALPIMPGMSIWTDTPAVRRAREGVLEFLLINHPLDCPICDQGGECDLQDQAMVYGSDRGRFQEYKRAVEDKPCGPLVQTVMTRCIHCTRCIRFTSEIAGTGELGTTGRGSTIEVGTYLTRALGSELSANVIDLCPVGALTSKPYAFTARAWELTSTEGIDSTDAVGSHIRYDARGAEILRILPRLCEAINETWISDKARYAYDGLRFRRTHGVAARPQFTHAAQDLLKDLIHAGESTETWVKSLSWVQGFEAAAVRGARAELILGGNVDQATVGTAVRIQSGVASGLLRLYRETPAGDRRWIGGQSYPVDYRGHALATSAFDTLNATDVVLVVGVHLRHEAALLNARFRARARSGQPFRVYSVGSALKTTYPVDQLGTTLETLVQIAEGRHPVCRILRRAKAPSVYVSHALMERTDSDAIWSMMSTLMRHVPRLAWNSVGGHANSAGALLWGVSTSVPQTAGTACDGQPRPRVWVQPETEACLAAKTSTKAFTVVMTPFEGMSGSADVSFATRAPGEDTQTWVNMEGRTQVSVGAVTPSWEAKPVQTVVGTWAAFRTEGVTTPLSTKAVLTQECADRLPNAVSGTQAGVGLEGTELARVLRGRFCSAWAKGVWSSAPVRTWVDSYYQTDALTRNSSVLSQCTRTLSQGHQSRTTAGTAWVDRSIF